MRITIVGTDDLELVRATVTHVRLWKWSADDYSLQPHLVKAEQFAGPDRFYAQAKDGDRHLGIFGFNIHNGACVEVHTCLLPAAWGEAAAKAARLVVQWIWDNTKFHRIITNVPAYNKLALQFAVKAGMEQFGINYASFMKDGKLHDQILLGISRPKEYPCL